MKKVIFAVLTAFVMSFSLTSCGGSPENQMIGIMEDMLSVIKDTHISSADDAKALVEKLAPFKEKMENAAQEMMKAYADKSPEEMAEIEASMKDLEKQSEKITSELEKEGERLEKEAKEAGVDLSQLDLKIF